MLICLIFPACVQKNTDSDDRCQNVVGLAFSADFKQGFGWLRQEVHDFQAVLAGGLKQFLENPSTTVLLVPTPV
jgi:hypothetical protein